MQSAECKREDEEKRKHFNVQEQWILYTSAYQFYEAGQYAQASSLFTQLILAAPLEEKYWRGLASSRQMEKSYQEALSAWSMTALLVESDPFPHFHAAECLLTLEEREEALKALAMAKARLKESDHFLRDKITTLSAIYANR